MRPRLFALLLGTLVAACSAGKEDPPATLDAAVDSAGDTTLDVVDTAVDTAVDDGGGFVLDADDAPEATTDAGCKDTPKDAGGGAVSVTLAAEYASFYTAFDLGPVPGMPAGHLGGCVLADGDPSTLLFAGDSESGTGSIWSIKLVRGACGHIVGFSGTATKVADTPFVDANLLWLPSSTLLYSQWPANKLGILPKGASAPSREIDLGPLGVDSSIGGVGFVPKGYAAEGQLRGVTWAGGNWFHLGLAPDGASWKVGAASKITTLPNGPGGFAYVPAGSPGFAKNRIILSEWSADSVATYEVDGQGDPQVSTRKAFFEKFTKPWGAYFDPVTGDFLFLTWGPAPDRVFVVQGFVKPPPPPPPPK